MARSVEVAVLGPLQVHVDGERVAVGERSRALVAALALRCGEDVSADRLIETLWPDATGADGDHRNALQALVSRTRQALGPGADVLATADRGYRLDVSAEAVDASRLETAVAAARRREPSAVDVDGLTAALALWRDDPFVEVADDLDAVAAAGHLRDLWTEGQEIHAEAVLAHGGDGAGLVAALRSIAEAHPTRERPHRALAVALYRTGRHTDALQVIGDLVGRLRDGLGLDPDPRTEALQTALLRHDLDVLTGSAPLPTSPGRIGVVARPLPRPRTSFVGRDEERRAVAELLDGGARLVTLVGPGGTGKTRLAIEVAAGLQRSASPVADEVVFVDLAALGDPADVMAEVAASIGLHASDASTAPGVPGERSLLERVRGRLRHARMVLVVDNCEHVIDAAAEVVELALDAGPRVVVLATSREGLRVDGERLWPVPPLAVAAPDDSGAEPASLLDHDSVRLFVDRAVAADPSFRLDATTSSAVVEICRRLDGLPLGIELAAARVGSLPVTTLAERLGDRFRLLTGGRRGVRRQETLEAVVAWSYDLLDDRQRRVFRRLGVFSGEVTIGLIEEVLSPGDLGDELPGDELLPTLTELAERSLLDVTRDGDGERVRMLETIRAYAQARMVAAEEATQVRTRHAEVLAERAAAASVGIRTAEQLPWFRLFDEDLNEHLSALAWSVATAPGRAVQMGADLAWYAWLRDRGDQIAGLLADALDADALDADASGAGLGAARTEDVAIGSAWLAFLRSFHSRQEEAEVAADRALGALAQTQQADTSSFVLSGVPLLVAYVRAFGVEDVSEVVPDIEQAIALADRLGEAWVVATGQFAMGAMLSAVGERGAALDRLELGLRSARGERWVEFQIRRQLALEAVTDGDYTRAAEHLDRAIPLGQQIGARGHARSTRVHRAVVDINRGELDRAREMLTELLAEGGGEAGAYATCMLALLHLRAGDARAAAEAAERALAGYLDVGERGGAVVASVQLVYALLRLGQVSDARQVLDRAARDVAGLPAVLLAPVIPYLLETAAAVVLAEGGPDAARRAAERLGRAGKLREDLGRPLVAGERTEVDGSERTVIASLGAAAAGAIAEGRDRIGLLPPLD